MKRVRSDERGVTLVELLVVIAIVALLAAFFIPRYIGYRQQAGDARVINLLDSIRTAVSAYEARTGSLNGLPCRLSLASADQWNDVRNALAPYATLPDYASLMRAASNGEACLGRVSGFGSEYTVTFRSMASGTIFLGASSGVYRCSGWTGPCTPVE